MSRQARVLIVEDSRTCREHLAARLRLRPCKAFVVEAATMKEAIESLGQGPWDLVVLDLDIAGKSAEVLVPLIPHGAVALWCTAAPERAPKTHRVIRKGSRWVIDIELILLGLVLLPSEG